MIEIKQPKPKKRWGEEVKGILDRLNELRNNHGVIRGEEAKRWGQLFQSIREDPDADDFLKQNCKGVRTILWKYCNGGRNRNRKPKGQSKIKNSDRLSALCGMVNAIAEHLSKMGEAA